MNAFLICIALGLQGCGGAEEETANYVNALKTQTYSNEVQVETTQQTSQQSIADQNTYDQELVTQVDSSTQETQTQTTVSNSVVIAVDNTVNNTASTTDGVTQAAPTIITAQVSWVAPSQRENGNRLDLYEISGYEVQYRTLGASSFQVLRVPEDGSGQHALKIDLKASSTYEVLIASYDTDGLYSEYTRRVVVTDT